MTLDDVYGSDLDRFPLEQEAPGWRAQADGEDLGLVWDETEVHQIQRLMFRFEEVRIELR